MGKPRGLTKNVKKNIIHVTNQPNGNGGWGTEMTHGGGRKDLWALQEPGCVRGKGSFATGCHSKREKNSSESKIAKITQKPSLQVCILLEKPPPLVVEEGGGTYGEMKKKSRLEVNNLWSEIAPIV